MGNLSNIMKRELRLLLDALSDGLRQEVRQRKNWSRLLPDNYKDSMSITGEREMGIASSLSSHLRLAGYIVQVESYVENGNRIRRPDFCIWLPESEKFIYLELKLCAWGDNEQYRYDYTIEEIEKLDKDEGLRKHPHGLVCIGLSKSGGITQLRERFEQRLCKEIASNYTSYREIGKKFINFQGMDKKTSHAVVGLWFRKNWADAVTKLNER